MSISLSIPAYLSNFSALESGRTMADLKVFYIGETEDGRIFDQEFADKLVKSLPYCPVVAYFSDLKDDFIGHNTTQYIYGLVQAEPEYRFEECEDGKTWLITKVMLYTDREDNIGQVAEKIIGQPQSLELNRKTVKYEMFTENGRTKIRFTEGDLVGLSVLGKKQKPAFTGSEFFMETDFENMRARFENFFSCLEENSRGEQMQKEQFEQLANFIQLNYTEKMTMVIKAFREQLGDTCGAYLVEMDDNTMVASVLSYETWEESFVRCDYTISEEAGVSFENNVAVRRRFLSAEEINYLEGFSNASVTTSEEPEVETSTQEQMTENTEEVLEDITTEESFETQPQEEEEKEEEVPTQAEEQKEEEEETSEPQETEDEEEDKEFETNPTEGDEEDEQTECESSEEDGPQEEQTNCSLHNSTALSDSERIELEGYRRQAKISLVNSFAELLDSKVLNEFLEQVDDYDYDTLETKLSVKYSQITRENRVKANNAASTPLSFGKVQEQPESSSYKDLVARRLKK